MNRFSDCFFAASLVLCVSGGAIAEGVLTGAVSDTASDIAEAAVAEVAEVAGAAEVVATGAADAMSEADMMAAWSAAATPGEAHAVLAPMVGTFKAVITYQMSPEAPVETSQGVSTSTLILGGRFLQSSYDGEAMGMPYQGLGITGYDNLTEQYVSTWRDSMGTNTVIARGTANDAGVLNLEVETFMCPMTGTHKNAREVWTFDGPDRHTFQWYEALPDGTEFLAMTIEYTRAPAPEAPGE